jgi:hypothetical protein
MTCALVLIASLSLIAFCVLTYSLNSKRRRLQNTNRVVYVVALIVAIVSVMKLLHRRRKYPNNRPAHEGFTDMKMNWKSDGCENPHKCLGYDNPCSGCCRKGFSGRNVSFEYSGDYDRMRCV